MKIKNIIAIVISLATIGIVACQSTSKKTVQADFNNSLDHINEIELGKMLYFDPRLSKDATVSCNSCHNVMNGGSDNRQFSAGIRGQLGGRNSPTVFNAAFLSVQFWDGRAPSLKEQAKGPLINPVEMGNKDHKEVIARLSKIPGYVQAFKNVYPGNDSLNIENLATAIAVYEKTLVTENSPFDRFQEGDETALTEVEKKGWETFKQVGCTSCHSGDHFAGPQLPEGQGFYMKFPTFTEGNKYEKAYKFTKDKGRYAETKNKADMFMFRVPTLRNIALTAPYFHNGSVKELDEAVKVMAKSQLNRDLNDEEVASIVVFLKSLTGTIPEQTFPVLPPTVGFVAN
ncbi:MAG: cytochrome-c peroxidase [Bdellovibrionaceae bacterium]|nr:cytochrome-c peroxidase [Pseudobdellovibrionaceae bacterium]